MLLWQGVGGGGPCVTHVAQLNGDHDGVAPSAMQHITKPTGWPALAGWLGCLAGWAAWAGLGVAGLGWAGLPGWQACCWLWAWCHDMCPPPHPCMHSFNVVSTWWLHARHIKATLCRCHSMCQCICTKWCCRRMFTMPHVVAWGFGTGGEIADSPAAPLGNKGHTPNRAYHTKQAQYLKAPRSGRSGPFVLEFPSKDVVSPSTVAVRTALCSFGRGWVVGGVGGACATHVAQLNCDHDCVAPSAMQHITTATGWPGLAGWLGCLAGWAAWAGLGVAGLGWAGLAGWLACCWLWAWCHDLCPPPPLPPIPACTVSMWYRFGGC